MAKTAGHQRQFYSPLCLKNRTPRDFPGGPVAKTLAPNAGGSGLIPGQGPRHHMPQLRILMPQRRLKISHAATKNWHIQINKINKYKQININKKFKFKGE